MPKKKSETTELDTPVANNFSFFNKMKVKNLYAENKEKLSQQSFIDTGCYVLNALLSGDMFGGYPSNKVIMLAGEEAVGKSLFAGAAFVRPAYLNNRFTFYIDTENAIEDEQLKSFGLDENSFTVVKCPTVEEAREATVDILSKMSEEAKKDYKNAPKAIFVLDSQGNLTTKKSIAKSLEGNEAKDMTKQQELKRFYSETVIPMGLLDSTLIVTNHVYENVGGYGDKKKIAGGSGGLYNSSIIMMLTKAKESEGSGDKRKRTGSIITMKIIKSRYVKEGLTGKFYLSYEKGLNPWYGLHVFAEEAGLLAELSESHIKKGVVKPTGLGHGKKYVLMDPSKEPKDWVVCNDKTLHSQKGIGTISTPLNEWIKENFKFKSVLSLSLDADESELPDEIDEDSEG